MKKRTYRNRRFGTNAIEGATTTNKDWGHKPVPKKGGKTTNATIKEGKKNA